MINIKEILKKCLDDNKDKPSLYKRNALKERLQIFVLDFIYANEKYSNLIFYGGSCLAQCYGLPRLSEDLDFVDIGGKINLEKLAGDLNSYFNQKTDLNPTVKIQKFRIYLKFPLLKDMGLSLGRETDSLYLKIEVFKNFTFCSDYKIEAKPLFKANRSILVKTFDLPTLMSTKIRAVLFRKWEKTDKQGKTIVKAKGRDYYDLMWYLEKGVKPNFKCLGNIKNSDDLKEALRRNIGKVDAKSIRLDLENFISEQRFVKGLSKNIKEILLNGVNKL